MNSNLNQSSGIANSLQNNKMVQVLELVSVFLVPFIIIKIGQSFTGENPVLQQSVVWTANVVMLALVWLGLHLRGQSWSHFGLSLKMFNLKSFLLSLPVFLAGIAGFMIGSIIMVNITGIPESADMSGYNYLQGNLPLLVGALVAVFIASSFGEEVIYRGFLITRISEMGGGNRAALTTAVVISSIIFGLVHFEWGITGIVQTGFMGLAFAVSYLLVKRNLWILILAHAYMDAILMIQMYLGGAQLQ